MNFVDILKGIGMLIIHTAEDAAKNPEVQQALVKVLASAVVSQASTPKS